MKLVIFGLTISSSWGNAHATVWRGLCGALAERGHRIVFFERDVRYYAHHRDLLEIPNGALILYSDWRSAMDQAKHHLADADAAIVTSYCPDGIAASELVLGSRPLSVYYDLDTPVTLERLEGGRPLSYIGSRGLCDFDLVLSFTGGAAIDGLRDHLGARRVATLYGAVDPALHHPVAAVDHYRADLSYIGTYAADHQQTLDKFFIAPARCLPKHRFLIVGAMYPPEFGGLTNIYLIPHIAPLDHPALYSSSRLTLNVTRRTMARMGYCPSGRLFEAAACGTPIVSDDWPGLADFFEPGREILLARDCDEVLRALDLSAEERERIARRARERALAEHSAAARARQLEDLLSGTWRGAARKSSPALPSISLEH